MPSRAADVLHGRSIGQTNFSRRRKGPFELKMNEAEAITTSIFIRRASKLRKSSMDLNWRWLEEGVDAAETKLIISFPSVRVALQ